MLLEMAGRRAVREACEASGGAVNALSASKGLLARALIEGRLEECRTVHTGLVCREDDTFPPLLSCIPDAPLALYFRGSLKPLDRPAIAIVGARRATRYGLDMARELGRELTLRGASIVSGLALGIDGAAHEGALQAEGETVAVLGSGLNRVQPRSNLPLARRILDRRGLLVSEYSLNRQGYPHQFPERNRLISGLCSGVVVVEASARSGSLITARFAAEQGREVMAVPGAPGLPNSTGANRLLKTGAALIESGLDVLSALGLHVESASFGELDETSPSHLTSELAQMLDLLDGQARSADGLAAALGLGIEECAVRLTELELGGFVQRLAEGYIRRPHRF